MFLYLPIVALTFAVTGCDGGRNLVNVTGSVIVDGNPANGATVLFHPENLETGTLASGTTDVAGKFTLISSTEKGIAPGTYKVTVVWPDPADQPTDAERMTGMFEDAADLLKGRYDTPVKSTLRAEITSATDTLEPFELSIQK